MEKILPLELSTDEEKIKILRLKKTKRTLKKIHFNRILSEKKRIYNKILNELICEVVFQYHMELRVNNADPFEYITDNYEIDASLIYMAEELNIIKVNQDIDCPKCFVLVKCLWLSKHLAVCMNPHQSTYSYSSRNSSRIARQRIQEGFKTSYEDSKNDSEDEKIKPKKRINKGRKAKIKVVKSQIK